MRAPSSPVHLVGSMPFQTGTELFAFVADRLRDEVRRIPDETGERAGWISLQLPLLTTNPLMELEPPAPDAAVPMPLAALRRDADPSALDLGSFAYGPAAAASYELFRAARDAGRLRPDAKLLVAMPAPMNPVGIFVHPRSRDDVLAAYERSLRASVDEILAAVPHDVLAIQWDLVGELGPMGSGAIHGSGTWSREDVAREVTMLGDWIPADVELGFHLCFGDTNRDNIQPGVPSPFKLEGVRPPDAGPLLEMANTVAGRIARRIDFIHMAIPIGWADAEQFAPLGELRLGEHTELYLGLVHPQDAVDGARRRHAAASAVLGEPFGIGTECGMGRYGGEEKFRSAVDTLKALASS